MFRFMPLSAKSLVPMKAKCPVSALKLTNLITHDVDLCSVEPFAFEQQLDESRVWLHQTTGPSSSTVESTGRFRNVQCSASPSFHRFLRIISPFNLSMTVGSPTRRSSKPSWLSGGSGLLSRSSIQLDTRSFDIISFRGGLGPLPPRLWVFLGRATTFGGRA